MALAGAFRRRARSRRRHKVQTKLANSIQGLTFHLDEQQALGSLFLCKSLHRVGLRAGADKA